SGNGGGDVQSNGGAITINADNMVISDPITAGSGLVTLDVRTAGRGIALGTKPGGVLGLTDAELDRVTAGILRIGDLAPVVNGITVTAAITAPAGWNTLELLTGAGNAASQINQNSSASITVTNLV